MMSLSVYCRGEAPCESICSGSPEPSPALCARLPCEFCPQGCIPLWLQDDEKGELKPLRQLCVPHDSCYQNVATSPAWELKRSQTVA